MNRSALVKLAVAAALFLTVFAGCAGSVPPEEDPYLKTEVVAAYEYICLEPEEVEEPPSEEYLEEEEEPPPEAVEPPPEVGESPPDDAPLFPQGESPPSTDDAPLPYYALTGDPLHDRWGPPLTAEEIAERLRTTTALPEERLPNQVILAHYWPSAYIDWSVPITDAADIAQIVELLRDLQPVRMSMPLLGGIPPMLILDYGGHTKQYYIIGPIPFLVTYTGPGRYALVFYGGGDYSVDIRLWQILDRYDLGV